ncbi:hypothetical protein [Capnocytophaga canis]|uniref:hypothetical protein n=1 Tax=Capnocytophaga canis TaxID=1848903 RepID=UPI001562D2AD|nr:hypothetical protein [Capnocytophaga canis]
MEILERQTGNKQSYTPQIKDFRSVKVSINETNIYKNTYLQIDGYAELFTKIANIIDVCRVALLNETEKIDGFAVSETLEVAKNLIPYDEFYLLDKLHTQAIENLKKDTEQSPTPTK